MRACYVGCGLEGKVMRKTKTHFQQVPVAVVEKLLEKERVEAGKKQENVGGKVVVERPSVKAEPYSVHINAELYSAHQPF
jgi:hypothetical protein